MIDLHCHCLPGIDDGPRSDAEAVALARALAANGIAHAVLTPHIYPGVYDNTGSTLAGSFENFRRALRELRIPMTISLGCEMRLDLRALELLDVDEIPFIGDLDGDRVLLMELPDGQIPPGTRSVCGLLMKRNIRPMIAHPERNRQVMDFPDSLDPLVDAGCLVQLTAASLTGGFGRRARSTAMRLVATGRATVVATDAHNLGARRPLLREARELVHDQFGLATAHQLTEETPARIVSSKLRQPANEAAVRPATA